MIEHSFSSYFKLLKTDGLYWFWDGEKGGKILTVGKLKSIHIEYHPIDAEVVTLFQHENGCYYRYCELFNGELPNSKNLRIHK